MSFRFSPYPPLLTSHEAADFLRVPPKQIQRWARAGRLQHYRVGRQYRFAGNQLMQFIGAPENSTLSTRDAPADIQSEGLQGSLEALKRRILNRQNSALQPPNLPASGPVVQPQNIRQAANVIQRALTQRKF